MVDLTVVILTKNEEKNIEKCIQSVYNLAKRIVVVDSFSTDNTKKICLQFDKVDFFEHDFESHAKQFDWAQKNTDINTRWIMRLDADEEVLPELSKEIINKLPHLSDDIKGIVIKIRIYFMGRWIKHGGIYPLSILRIIDRDFGYMEIKEMDEHFIVKGKTIEFENDIRDYNLKSLEWWTHKHNWYSNREVMDCLNIDSIELNGMSKQGTIKRWIKNKIYLKIPLFIRPRLYYWYRYYILLGFLDGKEGKIFHFLQAYWYRFLVDAKLYEAKKFNLEYQSQGDLKD